MKKLLQLLATFTAITAIIISCSKEEPTPEPIKYTLSVSAGTGGSVSTTGGSYEAGASVSVIATPNIGYIFKSWEGIESTSNQLELSINEELNIKAVFELNVKFLNDNIPYIVEDLVDKSGYRLIIENGLDKCYLIDEKGVKVHNWNFDMNLGQDIELAEDGTLFGMFKVLDPSFGFGGQSGLIRQIDKESNVVWEYEISDYNEIAHHDLEILPNGNLLILVWRRVDKSEAIEVGFVTENDIFVEKIIEINPSNNNVIWEWDSWDHIVQNYNPDLNNFGNPIDNKNKIDILFNSNSDVHQFVAQGDVMHANGLAYNEDLDIIAVSVNFYSEVWFLDHSTTIQEAKSDNGGNFNKGGDLLFRFGNPKAFGSDKAQIFDFNHHPTFIKSESLLNILIFNNNNKAGISKTMEFSLPDFNNIDFEKSPELIFEYSNEDLFFPRVGGAVRLPNGNTLICEGDYGYWEVNPEGETLWKYNGLGTSFWRGIYYLKNSNAIISLGL